MTWINPPDDISKWHGFVYEIIELDTGKIYIGCKKFWNKKTLKALKGKINKRHKLIESDWRTYNSSNKILQENIKNNPDNYSKVIVHLCNNQIEMKCWEAHIQLDYYLNGHWNCLYNEIINLRVRIQKNDKG